MANAAFSTGFRNALLDGTDVTNIFDSGELHIYSGSQPADADSTEGSGTILAKVVLPTTGSFAASASSGSLAKAGTWEDTSADASGTAAWFRLYDSAITTGASTTAIRIDGDVTATSGGGDLELTTTSITSGDAITIDTFTLSISAS